MSSRDHPFNRSTRPLLERKTHAQPQLLTTKKKINQPTAQTPPKMRGFNDFHFVPKLHAQPDLYNYYSGYPYGSPPSPTTAIGQNDFVFSDDSGVHSNDLSQNSSSTNPRPYDDDYADLAGDDHPDFHYGISNGNGLYQAIGQTRNYQQHTWSPAPVERRPFVSVESTKGPFIFGVDTNCTSVQTKQRFTNINNNNSVIHTKLQRAEQQQVIKAVSLNSNFHESFQILISFIFLLGQRSQVEKRAEREKTVGQKESSKTKKQRKSGRSTTKEGHQVCGGRRCSCWKNQSDLHVSRESICWRTHSNGFGYV